MIGVYLIQNTINKKCYVGSSVDINQRRKRHFKDLRKNIHRSILLQRSYNKYGEKCFKFHVLEILPDSQNLIKKEQHWMNIFKPEYNTSPTAGNCLGTKARPETIEKNRKRNSGFGNGNAKITKEQAQKISDERNTKTIAQIAKEFNVHTATISRHIKRMELKGIYVLTEEGRQGRHKPRPNAKSANKRRVAIIDESGKIIKEYDSCILAGKDINRKSSGITQSIKDNYLCAGYKFIYL